MDATDDVRVSSTTPLARPRRAGWPERHSAYCARAKQGNIDLLFIGDSLTQRWETAPEVWQKYYGFRNAAQMGIDNDYTQQILWRISHGCIDGISKLVESVGLEVHGRGSDIAHHAIGGLVVARVGVLAPSDALSAKSDASRGELVRREPFRLQRVENRLKWQGIDVSVPFCGIRFQPSLDKLGTP